MNSMNWLMVSSLVLVVVGLIALVVVAIDDRSADELAEEPAADCFEPPLLVSAGQAYR